MQTFSVELLV